MWKVGGAIAFILALASSAAAQTPPEPPLVPPRVTSDIDPIYPAGETVDASVLLEVVVEPDGTSGEIKVVEGGEPFASAAVEAVRQYRYEPARRGDTVLRARIRLVVTFTAPPPPPPPKKTIGEPPPPPSPVVKPTDHRVDEVTITGVRPSGPTSTPTEHRMGRAEVRMIPGAFGDPYRAIEILPGVVPTISGLPYYYVRGSPPSAVGYFVDEVRVPYLFHFALGPSVIQPALIDEVTLHPAAFPGRYGRYAGAIVAGKTRDPAEELYGEGMIRLFDVGAYVESPLLNGRASAGVGGRYSYTAALLSLFAKDTTIDYRDYNARFAYKLNDRWTASTLIFGSYDYASQIDRPQNEPPRNVVLFASEFHRADFRLERHGADGAESRIAGTVGFDRTRVEGHRFAQDVVLNLRARHTAPVSSEVDVEIGGDVMLDHYSTDLPSPFAVSVEEYEKDAAFFRPRNDTASGMWLSGMWHPAKGFDLTATARADVFTSDGKALVAPSPRLSMRVPVLPRLAFLGALGVAPQPPAFAIPVPAINYRGLPGGLAYGYQESAGGEVDLPLKFLFRVVGFHHMYFNLRDIARSGTDDLDPSQPQVLPSSSPTQAYGLEVFLNRKLSERFGAFVSYTLSRAEIGSSPATPERLSPFDRTHVFQVGGSADLGKGWRASARFLTYRGWPDEGDAKLAIQPKGHLPPYVRLDARLEKRWSWRKSGYISFICEVLNATGSKEIVSRDCNNVNASGQPECRDTSIGPILVPSIGVEGSP